MKTVSESLKLEEAVGVNEEDQLESILVKNGLIAAIQFHHSPVSSGFTSMVTLFFSFVCRLKAGSINPLLIGTFDKILFSSLDYKRGA